MKRIAWFASAGVGAALVAAALGAPALQATETPVNHIVKHSVNALRGGIGTFTPAAADPRLAAILERAGLPDSGFRFTPSESRKGGLSHAVTVAVQSRAIRGNQQTEHSAALPASVALAPIAYNLGVSVGWRRFAVAGDVAHYDLAGQSGSRDTVDVGLSYTGKRISGRIKAAAERPLSNTVQLPGDGQNYSLDVAGSYSLTHNFDVTAGVRYKSERDRLLNLTQSDDDRRDSQSVYIGTAFRF